MSTSAKRRPKRKPRRPAHPDTLRTSERNTLNRCRQRWSWSYNQRLRPKREAPALRFGTLIHAALEVHYDPARRGRRRRMPIGDVFCKLFDEELEATQKEWYNWRDEDDHWHTYRELGVVMLEGFLEKRKAEDDEYIVLAVEQRFEVPILVPKGEPKLVAPSPTKYVGTLDRILYHLPSRRLLFGDYKTTGNDPTKVKHLALDEQAGAYWAYAPRWLATQAPESLRRTIQRQVAHLPPAHRKAVEAWRFDGILYDFLKKDMPNTRPLNDAGYAVNKPKKDALVACAKKNGFPWKGLLVDELIEVIDGGFGEGWSYRHLGEVSKNQPGPLFHREPVYRDEGDRQNVLRRIYEDAKEIGMMRRGELAIKKSPDKFICIGCPFIDMCELHETQAPGWEEFREQMYEVWDPYSTYNIDADELE